MTAFASVLGVDASLASTGLARTYRDGRTVVGHIPTVGHRGDTLVDREHRLTRIVSEVNDWFFPGDLVVIEGPAFGAPGGSTWDRAGLWWLIVHRATQLSCPVAVVGNATRCVWATGSGRSDKAAVGAAMGRRLPDVEFTNSDEADAAALALMGAQWAGWSAPANEAQRKSIAASAWPAVSSC